MAALQKECDAAVKAAQEDDERSKEIEAALNDYAKQNKELEDRIETIINNRNAWREKSKKLEQTINDLKEKYTVKDTVIEAAEIEHEIKEINELAVIEYKYRHTRFLDERDTFSISLLEGTGIPFTQKRCVISMDGIIKAGIDADKVTVKADNVKKIITIGLPESKILSNELDENSLYVYLEEDSIFNKARAQDHSNLRQKMKDESQKLAKDNDVLEQADERAGLLIKAMLARNFYPAANGQAAV